MMVAALLFASSSVAAQISARAEPVFLRGRVVDAGSRAAIDGASVVASRGADTLATGYTDSIGSFNLPLG